MSIDTQTAVAHRLRRLGHDVDTFATTVGIRGAARLINCYHTSVEVVPGEMGRKFEQRFAALLREAEVALGVRTPTEEESLY